MPSAREELRRGVRDLIETASLEMDALTQPPAPTLAVEESSTRAPSPPVLETRPILRLVREAPAAPPVPVVTPTPEPGTHPDMAGVPTRKGVCAAYYINKKCWEVADAYCNQALHVCMLRDCPVYHLNRETLEQRFARKFAHLW